MVPVVNDKKPSASVFEGMIARAIELLRSGRFAAVPLALVIAAPAQAQVQKEEPDAEEIARTPLSDLNIDSENIPEVLVEATSDPYADEGLITCNDIVTQVARIDTVLGADYDLVGEEETGLSEGNVAQGVVGSFIPFRGLVREVSGAAGDQRKRNAAITAGMVRRGYLKGLGQSMGCAYPARPRAELMTQE